MAEDLASTRIAAGRAIREQLFGDLERRGGRGASDELAPEVGEISDEVLWGRIWADTDLPLETKSLLTIGVLLSLERYDYARTHISGARNLGIPQREVVAVVRHLLFYVGLPVVHVGLALVKSVYESPAGEMVLPSRRFEQAP